MGFQKTTDEYKGAVLSNTYLKLKYYHVKKNIVKNNVLDKDGNKTFDKNGDTVTENVKVSNIRASVWKYASKEIADNDVGDKYRIGEAIIINFSDKGDLINTQKDIEKTINELIKEKEFFCDCINVLEVQQVLK